MLISHDFSFKKSFHLFIPAFDDGQDHFKPSVWFYKIKGVRRDDDPHSGLQQMSIVVDNYFRLALDDLKKGVKRR